MADLFYLAVIWAGVFIASFIAHKTKLTAVLYYLAFGCVLVNLGLIPKEAPEFIHGFSELGIILIMFALGFEEDTGNFVKGIKRSWGIALFGALAPFFAAFCTILYFWQDYKVAVLGGLAMTATAVSLTMVSLKSEGLQRSRAATAIMASAILDDIAALIMVAILIPLLVGNVPITLTGISIIVLKAIAFFALVTIIGMWVFPRNIQSEWLNRFSWIRKYGLRNILAIKSGQESTLIVLFIALATSLLAYYFGFHPAIGAYMAGLILKEEYFHDCEKTNIYQQTKHIIDDAAFSWIGPVFFVVLGSHLILDLDLFISIIPQVIILTTLLFVAQVSSAAVAAKYTGNYHWHEGVMIGLGMLGRAELAFVVMNIGYIQYKILPDETFYTLMGTAFILNIAVPLTIRWWRAKYEKEEAKLQQNV